MRVQQSWRRRSRAASAVRENVVAGDVLGGPPQYSTAQASDPTAMPSVAHVSGPARPPAASSRGKLAGFRGKL